MKKNLSFLPVAITLAALSVVPKVSAIDYIWDGATGTGGTGAWTTPANWNLDSGFPNAIGDTATFSAGTTGTNNVATAGVSLPGPTAPATVQFTTVGSITQNGSATGYRIVGVSGSVLRVDSITNSLSNTVANSNTTSFFSVNYTGTAVNTTSGISAATQDGTLTLNSLNVNDAIQRSNVLAGNMGQGNTGMGLKVESGYWFLGGDETVANTYTGLTTVSGGTLRLNKQTNVAGLNGSLLINGGTVTATRSGIFGLNNTTTDITITSGALAGTNTIGFSAKSLSVSNSGTVSNLGSVILDQGLSVTNGTSIGVGANLWSAKGVTLGGGGATPSTVLGSAAGNTTPGALTISGTAPSGTPATSTAGKLTVGSDGLAFVLGVATNGQARTNTTYTVQLHSNTATNSVGGQLVLNGDVSVASGVTSNWTTGIASQFASGIIDLGGTTRTFNVGGTLNIATNTGGTAKNPVITGSGGITKTGAGTMTLGAGTTDLIGNNYTGTTTVTAGTLTLNKNTGVNAVAGNVVINGGTMLLNRGNQIADTASVTLGGGKLTTGGFAETVGALTLASSSIIDLLAGNAGNTGQLKFAASSGNAWDGVLSIWNYSGLGSAGGLDQIFFGTDNTGLTASQLSSINFFSDNGVNLLGTGAFVGSAGEVSFTAVPEPSTWMGAGMILGLAGWTLRKRKTSLLLRA